MAVQANKFNQLRSREKWDNLSKTKGQWYCPRCRIQIDYPHRAAPFSGASIHCSNCDFELTRRTGGGQADPFGWHLGKVYPPKLADLPNGTLIRYRKKLYSIQMGLEQRLVVDVNTGIWKFLAETTWRVYEVIYKPWEPT